MLVEDIRAWLMAATVIPIIFANQNAPRPPRPYATLQVLSVTTDGTQLRPITDNGHPLGSQLVSASRVAAVQVAVFADDPLSIADHLVLRLAAQDAFFVSDVMNLGLLGEPAIQAVPVLRDGGFYEPRAVIDLRVGFTTTIDDGPGWIQTAIVGGQIDTVVVNDTTITAP